jgi:hypothetical protein
MLLSPMNLGTHAQDDAHKSCKLLLQNFSQIPDFMSHDI